MPWLEKYSQLVVFHSTYPSLLARNNYTWDLLRTSQNHLRNFSTNFSEKFRSRPQIFRWLPKILKIIRTPEKQFWTICEIFLKFPKISEHFRIFPEFSENFRRFFENYKTISNRLRNFPTFFQRFRSFLETFQTSFWSVSEVLGNSQWFLRFSKISASFPMS